MSRPSIPTANRLCEMKNIHLGPACIGINQLVGKYHWQVASSRGIYDDDDAGAIANSVISPFQPSPATPQSSGGALASCNILTVLER